jgi:5-methylcytosine-specific restriction protein A
MKRRLDARSDEALAYRKLYDSARWKGLRAHQLRHFPLCKHCLKRQRITAATIANHVKPHKGDPVLFFDPLNLESTCKPCHDGPIQSFERTGIERGCDANGFPHDQASRWNTPGEGGLNPSGRSDAGR